MILGVGVVLHALNLEVGVGDKFRIGIVKGDRRRRSDCGKRVNARLAELIPTVVDERFTDELLRSVGRCLVVVEGDFERVLPVEAL